MISRFTAYLVSAAMTVCQTATFDTDVFKSSSEQETQQVIKEQEFDYEAIKALMPPQPESNSPLVGYNDRKSWWFSRNTTKTPPSAQMDINISQYDAYYLGDVSRKVIYLTFDEGY